MTDLEYFLANAKTFSKTPDGYMGYTDIIRAPRKQFYVSNEELLSFNPVMGVLLATLATEAARHQFFAGWAGHALRATVEHWKKPGPTHPFEKPWQVTFITRADLMEASQRLILAATLYQVTMHPAEFEYVTTMKADQISVPFDWAEQHWPGVVGRVRAARALDYDQHKTAEMAFSDDMVSVTPTTSLDGLTF